MAIYYSKIAMIVVLPSVLLILISSINNVSCSFHRRHQHHYMQMSSTTPVPATAVNPVKFPHLDRILHRYDEARMKSTIKPVVTTTVPPLPVRREHDKTRHWETEQAVLAAHPEMLADDWQVDDDDDEDLDESAEEDQQHEYKKEAPMRHHHHHQNDEALAAASRGSFITQLKWEGYGTRQDLTRTRNRQFPSEKDLQAALRHAVRVHQEGHCQLPKPRVVRVSDVYPHPSKTYIPSCTILHQCGDDTGCCNYESKACVAKHSHPVELFFYTSVLSATKPNRGATTSSTTSTNVERLLFYNHTECECQERADTLPRDAARQVVAASGGLDSRSYMRLPAYSPPPAILAVKPPNQRSFRSSDDMDRLLPNKGCRCPTEYSVRFLANGTCVCDCFDRQRECLRFKKGKNSFSVVDRNCVLRRECREPACEFGAYISSAGRCPIKWEQYGMVMHSLTPIHHVEPKPVEHPKPPVAPPPPPPPPASPLFSWSPKPTVTERPLHWTELQKMDHHQKPPSPWDTHKTSAHSDSKPPSSLHSWGQSSSRTGSYPSWAEPPKPAPASPQAHRHPWGSEQSKATQQQYPSWSSADSSSKTGGYPWSRTETRPSTGGGFPWNPAETARKQVAVTNRATTLAKEPAKPAPSSTWSGGATRETAQDSRLPSRN